MTDRFVSAEVVKDEASPFLQVMIERAGDLRQPLGEILRSGLQDAEQGQEMAPHAPATFLVDRVLGRTRQGMLRETGALAGSLVEGGAGNVLRVSETEGEAGTSVPYAKTLQEGTQKTFFLVQYLAHGTRAWGGRGIPTRVIVYWREERIPEYEMLLADYLFQRDH